MKFQSILIYALLVILQLPLSGQQIPLRLDAIETATGKLITITMIAKEPRQPVTLTATDQESGQQTKLGHADLKKYDIIPADIEAFWQHNLIEARVYNSLLASGYQYDKRSAMDELMKEFISRAEQSGSFYIDSYLEARLYGVLRRVYPVKNSDRRPGVISLRIFSDVVPDAWIGPEGTLIITTGLLTALNSEDEVMALMAQKVSHYALDSHFSLYQEQLRAGEEPALGNIIRFSSKQEMEADKYAVKLLVFNGKEPELLPMMLKNVIAYGELMGNYYLGEEEGLFPSAARRSAYVTGEERGRESAYAELIGPVISFNAYNAYIGSQYLLCRELLEKKQASGDITADDLVLLSQAMLRLSGSESDDEKALEVIRRVTTATTEAATAAAYKQEALILMRLGRIMEAGKALDNCEKALASEIARYSSMPGDWSQMLTYLEAEKEWINKMRRL